ncbi:STAS-like domain-containing protein [Shewanella algae]|uniref:STAS-like domain-containing protein n=1 Tax=Shewanella algae TaxID=38313 RepID=UPI0031F58DC3
MANQKLIKVVTDFYPRPKWRYRKEGDGSGQAFREDQLIPALMSFDSVVVDLTGYNRYGPSFISEAFGGLLRTTNIKLSDLREKLTIKHEVLPSIVQVCWKEMEKASRER